MGDMPETFWWDTWSNSMAGVVGGLVVATIAGFVVHRRRLYEKAKDPGALHKLWLRNARWNAGLWLIAVIFWSLVNQFWETEGVSLGVGAVVAIFLVSCIAFPLDAVAFDYATEFMEEKDVAKQIPSAGRPQPSSRARRSSQRRVAGTRRKARTWPMC
ncbi:hypothetical protein GCM10027053_23160 [Intrasporangium mesophilum]